MKRFLSSVPGLMVLVGFAALGAFALRSGSLMTFQATYTAMIFVLAFAGVAAWAGRHRSGGFWAGFAVFGSAYFFLTVSPRISISADSPPAVVNHAIIVAERVDEAAKQFNEWLSPGDLVKLGREDYYFWDGGGQLRVLQHRILTIHCLLAAWIGIIGGAIGMALASQARPANGVAPK